MLQCGPAPRGPEAELTWGWGLTGKGLQAPSERAVYELSDSHLNPLILKGKGT